MKSLLGLDRYIPWADIMTAGTMNHIDDPWHFSNFTDILLIECFMKKVQMLFRNTPSLQHYYQQMYRTYLISFLCCLLWKRTVYKVSWKSFYSWCILHMWNGSPLITFYCLQDVPFNTMTNLFNGNIIATSFSVLKVVSMWKSFTDNFCRKDGCMALDLRQRYLRRRRFSTEIRMLLNERIHW